MKPALPIGARGRPPEQVRRVLSMALWCGGEADPGHPAMEQAIDDGYVVNELSEGGGSCEVWNGYDANTGRRVAFKCADLSSKNRVTVEQMLRNEAAVLTKLDGVTGIEALDVKGTGEATYLVLPWIEGEPINDAVAHDPAQAGRWVRRALECLADMHDKGIAHGDLKPAHIIVTERDVVFLDFGLARRLEDERRPTITPRFRGVTPEYAPPEATGDSKYEVSTRRDAYSLGRVLDEMFDDLPASIRPAVRRVIKLSSELRESTDGRALLECYDTALRRRARRVKVARASGVLLTLVVGLLGSGLAVWFEPPLAPWSAGLHELAAQPDRVTVLHELDGIAGRATGRSETGRIAWLLHSNEVEVWAPNGEPKLITLPPGNLVLSATWGERNELLLGTRDGKVWCGTQDTPQPIARLDDKNSRFAANDGGIEGWSKLTQRVVRSDANGLSVLASSVIAAVPIQGPIPGWVAVDSTTRDLHVISDRDNSLTLRNGQHISAAYRNAVGDVAVGLSTGEIVLSTEGEALRLLPAINSHDINSICLSPDGDTVFIASDAVYAYDLRRGEEVASYKPRNEGPVLGLTLDPHAGNLTVVSFRSAESWQLINPAPTQASH